MSERIVLKDFPVEISEKSLEVFVSRRHLHKVDLKAAIAAAREIAKPRAIIKWTDASVEEGNLVRVGSAAFQSVLLADKLKEQQRVLLIVVTAGDEIKESDRIENPLLRDALTGAVLGAAMEYVFRFVAENFKLEEGGMLQPGSLPDWPIENNHALIAEIGGVQEDLGITLNEKGYMNPWNSCSGIYFAEAGGYKNCMLCKKLDCIGRRTEFNQEEYTRIFGEE